MFSKVAIPVYAPTFLPTSDFVRLSHFCQSGAYKNVFHFNLVGWCYVVAKSCLTLVTPWTVTCKFPLPKGFSWQEYWNGLPFPSPGNLSDSIEPHLFCILHCGQILYRWATWEALICIFLISIVWRTFHVYWPAHLSVLGSTATSFLLLGWL